MKRGQRKSRPPLGDLSDPRSLASLHEAFLEHSRVRGYREGTILNRDRYGRAFVHWCQERGITRAMEVTKPVLERYQRHLFHYRRDSGEPLSFQTQYSHLSPLKMFFKWLARENHILYNPASELELPRLDRRLPKHVLTAAEAERVLSQPDLSSPIGLRDRAILEALYSTGLRRTELIRLQLWDLDCERGTLLVRQSKGRKDRRIPIGRRAAAWLAKYLADVRPELVSDPSERTVFLTASGQSLVADHLTKLVHDYVEQAGVGKHGSCHLFRHTMATLMLEGGADIRFIQQMLGHTDLSTTQIYTQVSIRQLQHDHALTHPAEQPRRKRSEEPEEEPRSPEADALLSSLAAEAAEELL
jgi:integrase/recombinase XerD